MVRGCRLNYELIDVAFTPTRGGGDVANRVAHGKRPRSSMSPTLAFDDDGRLVAVVGSPGGAQIIGYVAKALVAMLDWDLDPQSAVDLPNAVNRNGPTELEAGNALRSEEHTSELQSIMRISYAVFSFQKKTKKKQ